MWETDFTKIYIDGEGWVYLTAYIDLCSKRIKGYLVSRMSRTSEKILALDNAILGTFPEGIAPALRNRSDNGSQLTSTNFEKHIMEVEIKHETIHAHTPEEDGDIESCFGRFKEDYICTMKFISNDEFQRYIYWDVIDYNTMRPHSSPYYMPPDQFEVAMRDKGFKRKWVEKSMGRYEHVEFLE